MKPILNSFETIYAQSLGDRERYEALGATIGRVDAAGNLKFDSSLQQLSGADLEMLRRTAGIDNDRVVWVAGSTHEGEEDMLLRIHTAIRKTRGDVLLIIAPRQVDRAREIVSLCDKYGLRSAFRSRKQPATDCAVYVLDTLGELKSFYALGDAAFIGGSLVPFGGHNPLEAVAHGKPTCWGPHLFNFREIEDHLMKTEFCLRISSEREMEELLLRWLKDRSWQRESEQRAKEFFAFSSGTSRLIARSICRRIPW